MQYEIRGGNLPAVYCTLEQNEQVITESGGMSWMSPNMKMETHAGGIGKAFGRLLANEHMFQNTYTAEGGPGMIAFSSSMPGEIRAVEITPQKGIIIQKGAFLASETSVKLDTFFQKSMGKGLFGGEGFVMSKVSGQGMVFLEIDGSVVEYDLEAGQQIVIATGYLAAMDETCTLDIMTIKGVKNVLFGGESLFNTVITGPGKVLIQTMPITSVAKALLPHLPVGNVSVD